MVLVVPAAETWTNWVGNQSFKPSDQAAPSSEDEVATLVATAARRGLPVRVAGAGHSFTPVVATEGLLLDLRGLGGIRSIDPERRRVVVGPATTIGEFGEPLPGRVVTEPLSLFQRRLHLDVMAPRERELPLRPEVRCGGVGPGWWRRGRHALLASARGHPLRDGGRWIGPGTSLSRSGLG